MVAPVVAVAGKAAKVAAKAAGLEFSPNAVETLDGVANGKFKSDKVTLLSFTNDELDQCSSLREALAYGGVRTNSVEIPGDHLSPVYLDLDKYAKMNPVMNRLSCVRRHVFATTWVSVCM